MRTFTIMILVIAAGAVLLGVKLYAWIVTGSNAILADALESIVNLVAGSVAAFAVHQASKPGDRDHPYGHGKVEFFSSGLEGSLILLAGLISAGRGIQGFFQPPELKEIDLGVWLTAVSLVVNGGMGWYLLNRGKKDNSIAIEADGRHLLSDAATSIGLLLGLLLILFTGKNWIDNVLSILFGGVIIYSGYKLARRSISGLMDEADFAILGKVIQHADANRRETWIDIHKLRVQKFGQRLHVDVHMTLPFYMSLSESHLEVKNLEETLEKSNPGSLEAFIHSDPCVPPQSCGICAIKDCKERKGDFKHRVTWTLENSLKNQKHSVET